MSGSKTITDIVLSNSLLSSDMPANSEVGIVTVKLSDGQPFSGQLTLSGPFASYFSLLAIRDPYTLNSVALSNSTIIAGPANAVVGTVSVVTSDRVPFSGTVSVNDTTNFLMSGMTLRTAQALSARNYPITLTAHDPNPACQNGTLAAPFTVTVQASVPTVGAFTVTQESGIRDHTGARWELRGYNCDWGDFNNIKASLYRNFPGANLVRVVCDRGTTVSNIQPMINELTARRVVCFIDYHDTVYSGTIAWYQQMCAAFKDNPFCFMETPNEPVGNVAQDQIDIINALRAAGWTNPIGLEITGGAFFDNVAPVMQSISQSQQIFLCPHNYNDWWNGANGNMQADANATGLYSVVDEFGDSTDGSNIDADGTACVQHIIESQMAGENGAAFWSATNNYHEGDNLFLDPQGDTLSSMGDLIKQMGWLDSPTPPQSDSFVFIAWGDTKYGQDVLGALASLADTFNPAFTLYSGDIWDTGWDQTEYDNWKNAVGTTLFDKTFAIKGNHDAGNDAEWQGFFNFPAAATSIGATNYAALYTDLTYAFQYQNNFFVGIDGSGGDFDASIDTTVINWVDQQIAAAESRGVTNTHIWSHGAIYYVDDHAAGVSTAFTAMTNRHPTIRTFFHGHEHVLAYVLLNSSRISNITHSFAQIDSGTAGADLYSCAPGRSDWCTSQAGLCLVTVTGSSTKIDFYNDSGNLIHTVTV